MIRSSQATNLYNNLAQNNASQIANYTNELLKNNNIPVINTKFLNIPGDSSVFTIKRVRYVKGEPLSIHISYVNPLYSGQLTPEALEQEQLCILLTQHYGLKKKQVDETLESILALNEEAELLNVEKGHPLLLLRDILYGEEIEL